MDIASDRNKTWSRDELILALEVYFRIKPKTPGPRLSEIVDLSARLRQIAVVQGNQLPQNYRSAASVVMKLMNFRSFDPEYSGSGLKAAGKADRLLWNELADDLPRLGQLASAVLAGYRSGWPDPGVPDAEEAVEGEVLARIHFVRERNRRVVRAKKHSVLQRTGQLRCEVCDFNFQDIYGDRGRGFIECHHVRPLHTLPGRSTTRLEDLAVVCANCHRMLHSARPWPTIAELRSEVAKAEAQ